MRSDLFSALERYPVPISSFAIPSDIAILGPSFGDQSYYADFAGIAKKYAPTRILEIGVRFGYSGIAMCLGALAARPNYNPEDWLLCYDGIDACFFSHPDDPSIPSHEVARVNFEAQVPRAGVELWRYDTRQGLPKVFQADQDIYDLINVDGDHSYEGCYRDLTNVWPLAAPGAIIIVDDLGMEGVLRAVEQFRDERMAELSGYQVYPNERTFALFQKGD